MLKWSLSWAASVALGICGSGMLEAQQSEPNLPADSLPAEIDLESVPGGFLQRPVDPADNPTNAAKVQLGRRLFFDPILSSDGSVSCASCHQPDHGFAHPEPLAVGIGGQRTKRNAPSLWNRGYGSHFFWDGRSPTLEQQALGPISSPAELGGDVEKVLSAIRQHPEYPAAFAAAFPPEADSETGEQVTIDRVAQAIASFERTLVSGDSPVDRFRRSEYAALSREARTGMWIFESRGGCWKCHSGPNFSDEDFHNTGVDFGNPDRDTGRMQFTGDPVDRFKFKTPSLRNVAQTAPYMHNGSVASLREVVQFYNKGGAPHDPGLDEAMKPLELTEEEVDYLVEFLKALTGEALREKVD